MADISSASNHVHRVDLTPLFMDHITRSTGTHTLSHTSANILVISFVVATFIAFATSIRMCFIIALFELSVSDDFEHILQPK